MEKDYNERRLEAELELIQVEINEREAKEKLFLTLNTILNIIGITLIILIIFLIIIATKTIF